MVGQFGRPASGRRVAVGTEQVTIYLPSYRVISGIPGCYDFLWLGSRFLAPENALWIT